MDKEAERREIYRKRESPRGTKIFPPCAQPRPHYIYWFLGVRLQGITQSFQDSFSMLGAAGPISMKNRHSRPHRRYNRVLHISFRICGISNSLSLITKISAIGFMTVTCETSTATLPLCIFLYRDASCEPEDPEWLFAVCCANAMTAAIVFVVL